MFVYAEREREREGERERERERRDRGERERMKVQSKQINHFNSLRLFWKDLRIHYDTTPTIQTLTS